jgi:hypothetical protein
MVSSSTPRPTVRFTWSSTRAGGLLPDSSCCQSDTPRSIKTAEALRTDIGKDAIAKYPAFDQDSFSELTDEDLRVFHHRLVAACCPADARTDLPAGAWGYDTWTHYRQPDWWNARFQPSADLGGVTSRPEAQAVGTYVTQERDRRDEERDERVVAPADDVSPHLDGRAQPGDILGIETGGERTELGDTAEDENRERKEAEEVARKQRE